MQSSFADALINIAITGSVIRLDFGVAVPVTTADGKQEVRISPTQQIVMPLEGFVRAFGTQEQVMKRLLADGVLKVGTPKPDQQPLSDVISTAGI